MKRLNWKHVAWIAACVISLSFGIARMRAQISEIQGFTAIETHTTTLSNGQPIFYSRILAVSGDGQRYSQTQQSQLTTEPVNTLTVVNKLAKTKISIDPAAKMLVRHPYHEDHSLTAGANCEGSSDGKIEGFDVNFSSFPVEHTSDGGRIERKNWSTPKLGCYILRAETLEYDKNGTLTVRIVASLSEIQLGEPDAKYFDDSLPTGYLDGKPEDYKGAVVNHQLLTKKLAKPAE